MFVDNLNNILKDLSEHRRDRSKLLEDCINERLSKSVNNYYSELKGIASHLESRNEKIVMKSINKEE